MTSPTPTFSVNVDVANPGQFLACCGLVELSHRLWPGAEGWFDGDEFHVLAGGSLRELLVTVCLSEISVDGTRGIRSVAPVRLDRCGLILDYWLRSDWQRFLTADATKRASLMSTRWKSWSGQQSSQQIISAIVCEFDGKDGDDSRNLFRQMKKLKSRLGLDHRTAWNTLDVGFSPNIQTRVKEVTCPYVELFAAIGLQLFRPQPDAASWYRYATWSLPLPARIIPLVALGLLPMPGRRDWAFRFVKRGAYKGLAPSKHLGVGEL